jgi:hypothetical protein
VLDVVGLRGEKLALGPRLKELGYTVVESSQNFQFEKRIPNSTEIITGIKHLAVWVSDPDPTLFSREDNAWENKGTFVFLTEACLDDKAGYVYSGCSALQAIANAVEGNPLNGPVRGEPFGRGSFAHPIEKLQSIGALVGDQRNIRSLYVKRCLTNEQCYTWNGERRRVNDLLGYPIFIEDVTF